MVKWNPSEGGYGDGYRGGLETRVTSATSDCETRWRISRSTYFDGRAEFTNEELRTTRKMYMKSF